MKKKEWLIVIAVIIIVAVVASFITINITGDVVKVKTASGQKAPLVYTAGEVDEMINSISVNNLLRKNCRLVTEYGAEGIKSESGAMCDKEEFALYGGGICYKSSSGTIIPNSHPFGYMTNGPLGVGGVITGNPQGWATQCQSPDGDTLVIAQANTICCN